jgi:hypothetical protein
VVDQAAAANRAAIVERLLEGVEDEAGAGRGGNTPADNAAGEGIDDEGRVEEALPGRNVGEVGHPKRVRPWCLELAVHAVRRARCRLVADRRLDRFAADGTLDAQRAHQPLAKSLDLGQRAIRCTIAVDTLLISAVARTVQWVASAGGNSSRVSRTTSATFASASFGMRDGRILSHSKPSTPALI